MVFLCFFAHSLLFYQAFASEVQQPVELGDDATLQCQAPTDAVVTVLEWSKPDLRSDDYVFFYRNERSYPKYQHPSFRGRVELRESSMKDGDVSIVLKNVSFDDAGTYRCRVIMGNTGSSERVFSEDRTLRVTEPDPAEEEEEGEAVGRLEKAVHHQGPEEAGSGARVAVAVGAVCVVAFLVAAVFVVVRIRRKSPKSRESPDAAEEHQPESKQMI